MTQPTITFATPRDIPELLTLLRELFSLESDFVPDTAKQDKALRLILDHPECGRIFVLRVGAQVAGMASALFTISTAEGGPAVVLEDVIVAKDFRGSGLGRQLCEHVIDWARQEGYLRITLLVDRDNTDALRFYARQGFHRSAMVVLRQQLAIY